MSFATSGCRDNGREEADMKHTPGPWKISRGAQNDAYSVEAPTQTICHVKHIKGKSLSTDGIRQEEANACLIAAAPAFYAEAREVVKLAVSECPWCCPVSWYGEEHCSGCPVANLQAAIAKAEGRDHP